MLLQDGLDVILKLAGLERVGLRRISAAGRFELLDGSSLFVGETDVLQLADRTAKLADRAAQALRCPSGSRRRIVQLVGQTGGKFAQRGQAVALLLRPRHFPGAVDHGAYQPPAQLRHVAQQLVKQRRGKCENSRRLDRVAVRGKYRHPRVRQYSGYGPSLGGKNVFVRSREPGIEFAFEDHYHAVGWVAGADVDVTWRQAKFR